MDLPEKIASEEELGLMRDIIKFLYVKYIHFDDLISQLGRFPCHVGGVFWIKNSANHQREMEIATHLILNLVI